MTASPVALPPRFADVEALEDFMSTPGPALAGELSALDGDLMVLGVGGKTGPTLARMAKRAVPGKRVIGVARFSEPGLRERLEGWGIECVACDLLDRGQMERLPKAKNIVFMAGHKFGAAGNPAMTWAMNAGMPYVAAETFRASRIMCFSTICVYPYAPVEGPGWTEAQRTEPPAGDYAASCVGREQMFLYGSHKWGTPGRIMRLSYAIDMRYGVLYDVATKVKAGEPIDVTMGTVNVIWQGDANEQALRLLARSTTPTTPVNITGPDKVSVRWLAQELGQRLGKSPIVTGTEAPTAWHVDTSESQRLFGLPRVPLKQMIDWQADWVAHGGAGLGKPTHFETRDGKY